MTKYTLWFNGLSLLLFVSLEMMGKGLVHHYLDGTLNEMLSNTSDVIKLVMYGAYFILAPLVNSITILIAPTMRVTLSK